MRALSKPVGAGGANVIADVKLIQQLINRNLHRLRSVKPLSEDGKAGPTTMAAVRQFQCQIVGMAQPDGLVSPGGVTFEVSRDSMAFVDRLHAAGYATDPEYATKLKQIIRIYCLDDYDR